jgi:HrpA-like RNA helicase
MSSSFRPAATYLIPESGKFKIDEHFWEGSALFESS